MASKCLLAIIIFAAGEAALAQNEANDPASCADLWTGIGLPTTAEDADIDSVLVCHQGYVLAHNSRTKTPDWVVERVTAAIAEGRATRPGVRFRQERNLPDDAPGAVDKDYTNAGFDRGHQAPSADYKSSADLMEDTFFLSNAVPQQGKGFNQDIWRQLEALVRDLAIARGELYVITGPVYQEGRTVQILPGADACGNGIEMAPLAKKEIGDSKVAVPAGLFKIIYDPDLGRANAYLMPNIDHRDLQNESRDVEYLKSYRVSVDTIEALTGWEFFTAFDERTQTILTEQCAAAMLH